LLQLHTVYHVYKLIQVSNDYSFLELYTTDYPTVHYDEIAQLFKILALCK
jgi:hypothetical protein